MCGIAGIFGTGHRPADKGRLKEMVRLQKHRGPDDEGYYFSSDGFLGLGHCRLSIIDVSGKGRQPMSDEAGIKWVVFNGEIYNYVELRASLEELGHTFRSRTDTEVIVHALEEWGEDALGRFNGMWAFAVWDTEKRELLLSRDRLGIKPLYYAQDGRGFVFASEIKALFAGGGLEKSPNGQAIYDYLISGYGYMDISDHTFFKGVKKVRPGHYMKITRAGAAAEKPYWRLSEGAVKTGKTAAAVIDGFRALFTDAVRLRLRSDVKVGVSLSGGLDSSSVACVAGEIYGKGRLSSFSSYFTDAEANEKKYIDEVLGMTGFEPNFVSPDPKAAVKDLDDIIWHQEEPYSTLSILPQWHIMETARKKGVKVLLTGQAGDETLGGYHKYYFYLFADLIKRIKWGRASREIAAYTKTHPAGGIAGEVARILVSSCLPEGLRAALSGKGAGANAFVGKAFSAGLSRSVLTEKKFSGILNNDLYNGLYISPLPSLLHIDDRASMAHSVETRSPFLDYRLIEYLFSVDSDYKIRGGMTKFILREAMKGILPEDVRTRRDKMGFPAPLKTWLRGPLNKTVAEVFASPEFASRPYLNAEAVKGAFAAYSEGKSGMSEYTFWSCFNLELWLRKFMDRS